MIITNQWKIIFHSEVMIITFICLYDYFIIDKIIIKCYSIVMEELWLRKKKKPPKLSQTALVLAVILTMLQIVETLLEITTKLID